ncbi:replication initiator protein A [Enterococcus faecium]|uniref:replication initiator protein A n=1 Tax=Enterococcus faecium TaxID=1352 RepID=UPI001C90DF9B|nr:replication initiator protein A [Enterococcus faecium]MBY3641137.1 replication initiator protein A [Enterococcus faecium]MCX3905422.1 replication initiator protein A [Enterococcus faecium]MCX3933598.1 replication initiator protein A [Enterococcus faecium]MCX3974631.1 replication initiator protein A [Enterococcus faecium]MCX4003065.1 replication initiator protein A [Enterococcus faecium]
MSKFQFYKSKEVYREKYYQMPKVFFTNEKYLNLSNDAKITYMLLKARFDYSVQNNWVDSEDNIYFIYTIEELMRLLNCREGKISKIKKELEAAGLLKQKKGRIKKANGKIETTPNLLYLGKPEVTSEDVFKINEEERLIPNPVDAKIANTEKDDDIKVIPVNAKIANTEKASDTNSSPVNAKIADNILYSNNSLDTNRHNIDTDKDQLQDQLLLENFVDIMTDSSIDTFIPTNVLKLIKTFSNSYSEAQQTVKTIHNAKHKAQESKNTIIVYEEIEYYGVDADKGLYMTLLKAYQKQKTEKVDNLQNLIFIYVKNWFAEKAIPAKLAHEKNAETNSLPAVNLENWLD